jgi:hypothetical protein
MRPEHTTNSTHMLLPNKNPENMEHVESVDQDLRDWFTNLPDCCQHLQLDTLVITDANKVLAVQRNLLHMIYHTTISALHRPLFLPASPNEGPSHSVEVQETARQRVREAAEHITRMAAEMRHHNLERYLPTTGVTVILPAMIVHMLDTKSLVPETRANAVQGLKECLIVMSNLRNIYAAADFATGFLDALLRKGMLGQQPAQPAQQPPTAAARSAKMLNRVLAPALNLTPQGMQQQQQQYHQHLHLHTVDRPSTPPPESGAGNATPNPFLNLRTLSLFPSSSSQSQPHHNTTATQTFAPNADGTTDLAAVSATTPPHTDSEDVSTPPHSQDVDMDVVMADELVSLEYAAAAAAALGGVGADGSGAGHTAGAAGAGAGVGVGMGGSGNNFDFDQWLQFPAEAGIGSSADDSFMGGMFNAGGEQLGGMEFGGEGGAGVDGWIGLAEGISH